MVPAMRLGQDVLSDPRATSACDWMLGNGLRGSASGTVASVSARAAQALLTVPAEDGRLTSLLLRMDERLVIGGAVFDLGFDPARAHALAGTCELESFALDPWPRWRYRARGVRIEKSLFMVYGHHAIALRYRLLDGGETRITACPLLVARAPGELQREIAPNAGAANAIPGRVRIAIHENARLTLWHDGAFMPTRTSQRVTYGDGDETREEALVVGYVERRLGPGGVLNVIASAEDDLFRVLAQEDRLGSPPPRTLAACVEAIAEDEAARVASWRAAALAGARVTATEAAAARARAATSVEDPSGDGAGAAAPADEAPAGAEFDEHDTWIPMLAESLRAGLVRRGRRLTIVSSYPQAEEHTAEVLRALVGLIALRGFVSAREILRGLLEYADDGLLPERFGADGRPGIGAPLPALWLVIMCGLYARRSGDHEFTRDTAYPVLAGLMHFLRSGTRTGVHVDDRGLLVSREGEHEIVRCDLNILWSNAQATMSQLARAAGRREHAAFHLAWAREHQVRFNEVLWDEAHRRLYRALTPAGPVEGFEPAHLLAVSLSPMLLPADRARAMIGGVRRGPFTPWGVRIERGIAATAWIGAFLSAHLRAHGRSPKAQDEVRAWLGTLHATLARTTPGHLPESFSVSARRGKKTPGVTPAGDARLSTVAAAELLRVWVEELEHAPSSERVET